MAERDDTAARTADNGAQPPNPSPPRVWFDDEGANPAVVDYTLLVPASADMEQTALMQTLVADVLRRNGYPAEPDRINAITETMRNPDGNFDFNREVAGSTLAKRAHHRGASNETYAFGREGPGFDGYSLTLLKDFQNGVLAQNQALAGPPLADKQEAGSERMIQIIENLKLAAGAMPGGESAKEALDTLAQALQANKADAPAIAGVGAGASSLKTVAKLLENIAERAKPGDLALAKEGAELVGRAAAVLTLPVEAYKLGNNVYKLYTGVDENGKALTPMERVKVVEELADNGLGVTAGAAQAFRIGANLVGKTAAAEAAGGVVATAEALGGPVSAALLWVQVVKDVVERGGEAIQSSMERVLADRFGKKTGGEALDFLGREERRAARMPVDEGNAASTATRIINYAFRDADGPTSARFMAFLKERIDPVSVNRISQGKDLDKISPADYVKIATAAKAAVPAFAKHEIEDVKSFVLKTIGPGQRPGDTYLRGAVEQPTTPGGAKESPLYAQILERGQSQATQRGLNPEQWQNASAALTASAASKGISRVDNVVWNDNGRVFAVQNVVDGVRLSAHVDKSATSQSIETSNALMAQAKPQPEIAPTTPADPARSRA